ncbi:hypothetical protein FQN54_006571 [Arachnomyces sp. PD_36]|nr:hypothetical protein FQN54_006571 [Arachnomyces sp. PD_36]
MLLSKIFAGAVMATSALAALTPQQIVDGIGSLTSKAQEIQAPATEISIVNAPLIIIGQGPFPPIITKYTEFITISNTLIGQFHGTPQITGPDATKVFEAYREHVRVHQATLNILIGKAGILQKVPFVGAPIAAVLRQVEANLDTIAVTLIETVQSQAGDLTSEANSLGASLDLCIQHYEGLAV